MPNNDIAQRLLAKFALIGDRHEWIRQIGTYPLIDVYSNDLFSQIREEVMAPIVGDGALAAPCSQISGLENPGLSPRLLSADTQQRSQERPSHSNEKCDYRHAQGRGQ